MKDLNDFTGKELDSSEKEELSREEKTIKKLRKRSRESDFRGGEN